MSNESYNLISLNIHHGRALDGADMLNQQASLISNYDIALIQETERNTERNKNRDLLAELSEISGLRFSSEALWHPYTGGEYGVGVLSKLPILYESSLLLPKVAYGETRDIDLKVRKNPEQRGLHIVKIGLAYAELTVVNTHSSLWAIEREVSDVTLSALLTSSTTPTIVGGDLNIENFNEYPNLRKFQELCPGDVPTYPAINPTKSIDKLFGVHINALSAHVLPDLVSDHRAIALEFRV